MRTLSWNPEFWRRLLKAGRRLYTVASESSVISLGEYLNVCRSESSLNGISHPDPFYIKEEFAPSDKHELSRKQQAAHDWIAPHLRLLQFLNSHFNATRLGSPQVQKIFHRMISITLQGIRQSTGYPLAREFHFQVVLLSLNIIRYSPSPDPVACWKLKDAVLGAGLRWFAHQPRCGFFDLTATLKADIGAGGLLAVTVCRSKLRPNCWPTSTKPYVLPCT